MKIFDRVRSILLVTLIVNYLVDTFFPQDIFQYTMALILVTLVIINLPFLKGSNKYISLTLLTIGLTTMIFYHANFGEWLTGINKNTGLVILLVTVPMLGFPLYYEDFQTAIGSVTYKYLNTSKNFYTVTTILAYSLSMLLNIASIPIISHLLGDEKENFPKNMFSMAITRGFNSSIIWSPNFVSVAIILHYLEIPWIKIVPIGLIFTFISILFSINFEKMFSLKNINHSTNNVQPNTANDNTDYYKKLIFKLISLGIFIILLIIVTESLTGFSILVIVPLASIIIPFLLAIIWSKQHIFINSFTNYYNSILPNMKNEVVLFSIAGFFGHSLQLTGVGNYIATVIYTLGFQESYLLIAFLMLTIVLLSILGIHPVISVSTILVTLPLSTIPLMPIQFALTLLSAYAIAVLLSPISGTVLITAGVTQENPIDVSIRWNWHYGMILGIIYICILSFIPF